MSLSRKHISLIPRHQDVGKTNNHKNKLITSSQDNILEKQFCMAFTAGGGSLVARLEIHWTYMLHVQKVVFECLKHY